MEREASRACCRGDPVTVMNVEEWGIFSLLPQCSDGRMLLGECRIDQLKMEECTLWSLEPGKL